MSLLAWKSPLFTAAALKTKRFRVCSLHRNSGNRALARKIIRQWTDVNTKNGYSDFASLIQVLSVKGMPHLAQDVLLEIKSEGFLPNYSTLSALMLCYADNGFSHQAHAIWEEMLYSSFVPNIKVVSQLIDAYGKMGCFDKVIEILDDLSSRNFDLLPEVYSLAISCFGKGGQLELMEHTLKKMVLKGHSVDSATGNAFIRYYSIFGSITEMETAYGRLKRSRHRIDRGGIKAMSLAYIKEEQFYKLSEFLRNVGLRRKDVGNLLWNLLLLSYAANFKMKSLQREFLSMVDAGFHPDLTTFNIRALAFSKMLLFWDIHLTLEHMKHEDVVPDLVTYGCVVDAYLDRRLGKNLNFALDKMNLDESPQILTDSIVFEALGKGDFHSSSEAFMEFHRKKKWTYRELIAFYLKKHHRRNQIFWNY